MSDDVIRRSDAIKAMAKAIGRILYDAEAVSQHVMNSIPAVEPNQEWIPCSERLPENGHYYLWCSDMGSVQSDYYWDGFDKGLKYGYNIVAWMPLPEPWKGADDD